MKGLLCFRCPRGKEKCSVSNIFRLDGIFGSGMVLQRGRCNKIWGTCPQGAQVSASIDGEPCASISADSSFAVTIPPQEASVGRTIELTCADQIITLEDVCFGEVFLLSGQSNMQLEVNRVMDVSGEEILSADCSLVRHFTVEPRFFFGRQAQEIVPAQWKKGVYPDVMGMSAAGFFFGRRMQAELGVPVGLVLNAMGGSTIEAWMPEELLAQFGDYAERVREFCDPDALPARIGSEEQAKAEWINSLDTGSEAANAAAIPADAKPIAVPVMTRGTDMEGYSGSVWFYREIELDTEPEGEGLLYLGDIIDSDRTYINGQLVGETFYRYPPRKYPVPVGLLRKGKNLIACRMVIDGTVGGFVPYHPYFLDTGSQRIGLEGEWLMKPETRAPQAAPPVLFPPVLPTGLYNASLYPLRDMQFAGMLWYQGESNVEDPDNYNEKFNVMMTAWRELLGQELPVVCVELCDYIDPTSADTEVPADWRAMQEMQLRQPEFTARCAVARARDLGEELELHPQRKQELGERLAQQALRLIYNR